MDDDKMVSAEEARGCGDGGCVFRAPSDRGQHTNAGCRCLPLRMTPAERVGLREQIRSLVVELDGARKRLEGVGVVECLAARDAATRERERANKAERERDGIRRILDLGTEDDPVTDECLTAMRDATPEDVERVKAYAAAWVSMCTELEAERDRLARILAVERGDESQAPEGWSVGQSSWMVYDSAGRSLRAVWRPTLIGPWSWTIGECGEEHTAPSALEAMEAADAAREGSDV